MKVRFNRETIIGLSVVLVLAVTLIVVAVRRFTRPSLPPEAAAAAEQARLEEPPREEHRGKELEALKPTFETTAPAATEPKHEDVVGWESRAKEHHEEKSERAPELNPLAANPVPARLEAAHDHTEHPAQPVAAADDRYAIPTAPQPDHGDARARSTGFSRNPEAAQPNSGTAGTVIQVGGDSAEPAPRRLDGNLPERRPDAIENRTPYATGNENTVTPNRFAVAPRGDAIPAENRGMRPETPNQAALAPPRNVARDPRYAYEPAGQSPSAGPPAAAVDVGPPNYPGPAAAYGRENSLRRPEVQTSYAQPAPRSDGLYEVQPNDSYWTISERVYGSGAYFRALAEVNRGKAARPDRLPPGLLISTPPVAQLEKDYPDFCPRPNRRETVRNRAAGTASMASYAGGGRTYVVQEGDTLSSIARNELGKVSRWAEIYQLNREALGKDYDYLTPGLRLVMPARDAQTPDRTTRRPDEAPPFTR